MKKYKFLGLLLALLLTVQTMAVPAFAETEPSTSETAATDTTAPSMLPTEPPALPAVPLDGDASVNNGCHSINAKVPMASTVDYTVQAKGALLYEIDSDTLVYSYNPDEKLYPASLTKVMTCLVALEMADLDEIVTVPQDVIDRLDPYGSAMDLKGGEEIRMLDLLYGLMVDSANDAAMVIAQHLAGSEEAFVAKMNQKAAELGCEQTHFANVHGLHDENHYTTTRDMAKIMLEAIKNEVFCELYSTSTYAVPATNMNEENFLVTTNYMISEAVLQAYYDSRIIGGKTGFTTPAGRCLMTVSESNGMRMLCVILGAEMEFADDGYTVLRYGHFEETKGLIDFGYSRFMSTQVLTRDEYLGQFPVVDGDSLAQGVVRGESYTVLPAGSDVNSIRYEYVLDNPELKAPVEIDEPIGLVRVWYQTKCVAQQEMFAAATVKKAIPMADLPTVDPAQPVPAQWDLWHIVLIVILVLLAGIFLLLLGGYIRAGIQRSRRKKQRAARRRAAQKNGQRSVNRPVNRSGQRPVRRPDDRDDRRRRR